MKNTKRILIIDDDLALLDILMETLKDDNSEVKSMADGKNVFEEIKNFDPQLIIVDYILQGVNGGEICHQIKNNPLTHNLPVIMLSAYPKVLNSLGNYGWDRFIEKPFDLWELLGIINSYFEDKKMLAYEDHR